MGRDTGDRKAQLQRLTLGPRCYAICTRRPRWDRNLQLNGLICTTIFPFSAKNNITCTGPSKHQPNKQVKSLVVFINYNTSRQQSSTIWSQMFGLSHTYDDQWLTKICGTTTWQRTLSVKGIGPTWKPRPQMPQSLHRIYTIQPNTRPCFMKNSSSNFIFAKKKRISKMNSWCKITVEGLE